MRTLILLLLFAQAFPSFGQTTCMAVNESRPWKYTGKVANLERIPKNHAAGVTTRAQRLAEILMKAYPDPKGLEANMRLVADGEGEHYEFKPELTGANAPLRYSSQGWFFALHCNPAGPAKREVETGTQVNVYVNWLYDFMDNADSPFGNFTLDNGQQIYFMPYKIGELKGQPLYCLQNTPTMKNQRDNIVNSLRPKESILITRKGKLPFRAVQNEEYLTAVKKGVKAMMKESEENESKWKTTLKESLAEIDKMKFASEAQREKEKASARRDVDMALKNTLNDLQRYRKILDGIDQIISALSQEERKKQAIALDMTAIIHSNDMLKEFRNQQKIGRPLITHDFSYYDPKMPRSAIQFIQLHFRYETHQSQVAKEDMVRKFRENIDLEALQSLLDKS